MWQHLCSCHPAKLIKTLSVLNMYYICNSQMVGRNASSVSAYTLCVDKANCHKPLFSRVGIKKHHVYWKLKTVALCGHIKTLHLGSCPSMNTKDNFPVQLKIKLTNMLRHPDTQNRRNLLPLNCIFSIYGSPFSRIWDSCYNCFVTVKNTLKTHTNL